MIPTIGLLLCVYLVFKGFEILQIERCAENPPTSATAIGVLAVLIAVVVALFFAQEFISMSIPTGTFIK